MIYTVTFNPSIDYIVNVEELLEGEVNRSTREIIYPGGKGINVSIVLKNLGYESTALGFTAGFTGREIERLLRQCGCNTDFIEIENDYSRINMKIKYTYETDINGCGPEIKDEHIEKLFEKLSHLSSGDTLVLAGSIPNTLPCDIYEQIMQRIDRKGIEVVVDATKELLVNCLKYKPFLIKPNNIELGEIFNTDIKTSESAVFYAKKLKEMGAANVIISMADSGAVLVDERGTVHTMNAPEGRLVNSVGAGDSMVAGFIAGYKGSKVYETAFKMGIAAGSATAFSQWLASGEDINVLMKKL